MISDPRSRNLISRRRFLVLGTAGLAAAAFACSKSNGDPPITTLDRTIAIGPDGGLLKAGGEPFSVRTDLVEAQTGREGRRVSLIAFHHLSDFRITDEESPARAEWTAECTSPDREAYRPQESLTVQAADALIGAANALSKSPATGRAVDFAIHTGNAADNAQFNELRWFMNVMDGGTPVYPDSGAIGYQGVQTESPSANYGDLLKEAQRQFQPVGLHYPWYAVLGNRDILSLGSITPSDRALRMATGAQKVMALGPDALAEACAGSEPILGPDSPATILNDPGTIVRSVGKDANRRFLTLLEWVAEHFVTGEAPGPSGHGFSQANVDGQTAYYGVDLGSVAIIALDSTNPAGGAGGSIGEAQFAWLEQQLIARSSTYLDANGLTVQTANPDRLIIIASHHSSDAMNNPFPGPVADERRYKGAELEALLHRFPNVILHISGHTLAHRITARAAPEGRSGYWEITTGSSSYWPMQGRLIDIVDNKDGTLSILSAVYDSAAPVNPGDAEDPRPDDQENQRLLASVARQAGVRDTLRLPEAAGLAASDRNAELILPAPVDLAAISTPGN